MPPKVKYTRESVLKAAFEITRTLGAENVNVRSIAKKLGCSTQPVMYHFPTVDKLRTEIYNMADEYHTEYITKISGKKKDILLNIGLRYIRFAVEETQLFRFLFQSEYSRENYIAGLADPDDASPFIMLMTKELHISAEKCRDVFLLVYMFVHGYASLLANSDMSYDEESISKQLRLTLSGALNAVGDEAKNFLEL